MAKAKGGLKPEDIKKYYFWVVVPILVLLMIIFAFVAKGAIKKAYEEKTTAIKSAKDGVIETYPAMGLSLTFDHRVIDGAPAARYMSELCKSLENFMTLLAK